VLESAQPVVDRVIVGPGVHAGALVVLMSEIVNNNGRILHAWIAEEAQRRAAELPYDYE